MNPFDNARNAVRWAGNSAKKLTPSAGVIHAVVHTGTLILLGMSLLVNLAFYKHRITMDSPAQEMQRDAAEVFNAEKPPKAHKKKETDDDRD